MEVYRRLRAYYLPFWRLGLTSLVFVALSSALGLVTPSILRLLIDRVIVMGRYNELPYLALAVVIVAIVRGACRYGRSYAGHVFGTNSVYELRNALYARLQSLSFRYYDTARTGDLMARLAGDVEVFRQFLAFGFAELLDFFLMVGFGLAVMLSLNWRLTLVSLVTMPILGALAVRFHGHAHPAFARLREAMADMSTVVQESITGVRTVKSYAREPYHIDLFRQRIDAFVASHMNTSAIWARFFPTMELMGNIAILIVLYVGGKEVIAGRLSYGGLVAFFSLIWYIIGPVQHLGYQINNYTQSVAAGERLLEVLHTKRDIKDAPDAVELGQVTGRVCFERVSFAYGSDAEALTDISLSVEPGMVVGIVGPTGSGKTSLVSLIPRFYDVSAGRVLIDGHDVRKVTLASLRRQVGVVFQETFLFSTTLRENIAFGRRDASAEEIESAARAACAHDFIMELPAGYNTLVGERGVGLSGGQKQRIAIARALLADPRILILDDATASVDMETELEIQKALQILMRGRTTFIIAHRISSVQDADLIIALDQGRIVESGTHQELLALGGMYKRIYDVQFKDQLNVAASLRGTNGAHTLSAQ